MITKVRISKFKNIQELILDLTAVNVLVGGNNSGKSSTLQAIQLAVSVLQTIKQEFNIYPKDVSLSRTLSQEQVIYSPTKDMYLLIYGDEPLREGPGREITVEIENRNDDGSIESAEIIIRKGRNKSISVSYKGATLCGKIADIDHVFSMYVPGLAGVPFLEEYRSLGAVRRAAARGDCNTILRNVLHHLYQDTTKKTRFLSDLKCIFPSINIDVDARLDNDGIIDISVKDGSYTKPLDSMGTGILQAIQICAYMNFFEPQILLLDEPDSHLHPTKQKMLAEMILQLSQRGKNIILATHSRHLVSSLRNDAKVFLMKDGAKRSDDYSEYDVLMEIGALDEYDVFRDPNIKYIIATEDTKKESNDMLDLILQASGFRKESYCILPYAGCSKVDSAIYVSKCLKRFRSDLKIIIHRDRDGMTADECSSYINTIEEEDNTHCFLTEYNDIEMYFCMPNHIFYILSDLGIQMTEQESEQLFDDAVSDIQGEALAVFLNRKLDSMREQGRGRAAINAQEHFNNNLLQCINGHLMMGRIASVIHQAYHVSKSDLYKVSNALCDEHLKQVSTYAIPTCGAS